MSKDLNLCQFIGRLGNEPDIRFTQQGTCCATISIGCGDDYKDKQTNQKVEQTNWIRVVAFGSLAEVIKNYTRKGSRIYVQGKQVTRKWQDQNGQDQYTTEINARELQLLDSKQDGQQQGQPLPQQQANQAAMQAQAPMPVDDFDDDSIPF